MIKSKTAVYAIGTALAVVNGVQVYLHIGGEWHAVIVMATVFFGGLGIQAATPAQISAKIPANVATVASSAIGALIVLQQMELAIPKGVQVALGVVLTIAATVGIHATNIVGKLTQANKPAA